MKALKLREFVSLSINCLSEGLDSKAETVDKIVDFVEKEYVELGELKKALEKMEGVEQSEEPK
jgi:hypothetical protein